MHKDPTLITKFEVSSADTDLKSRLRLSCLINYLIQSAIQSADDLGFGFANLSEQKMLWVLSRMNVEIVKPLNWYDTAIVETWPKTVERIFYMRDFIVRNQHNEIVAKATSAWLAIDLNSRRPKVLPPESTSTFTLLKDKHALKTAPLKLPAICGEQKSELLANYSDIDLNGHVTSTRYIDWMMDTFPIDFHQTNYPKYFCVNYLKETLPSEKITLNSLNENNYYSFEGNNLSNMQVAFRGRIDF